LGQRERKICRDSAFEGTFFGSVMVRIIETERCLEWTHGMPGSDPAFLRKMGKSLLSAHKQVILLFKEIKCSFYPGEKNRGVDRLVDKIEEPFI